MVDVVSVLPNVAGQKRGEPLRQRATRIGRRDQLQAALAILHEPAPARAELFDRDIREFVFEFGDRAEVAREGAGEFTLRLAAALGGQTTPEERVVPDLGGVVENGAARGLHERLEILTVVRASGNEFVQVVDVGFVVFAVVVLERFFRHMGCERIESVRERGQFVSHLGFTF